MKHDQDQEYYICINSVRDVSLHLIKKMRPVSSNTASGNMRPLSAIGKGEREKSIMRIFPCAAGEILSFTGGWDDSNWRCVNLEIESYLYGYLFVWLADSFTDERMPPHRCLPWFWR